MDKYEFNVKVEQIKKMVGKSDYETAMKIADTVDWRRVRNVSLLSMVATVYEKNEEYQEAKDILLLAFERAPIGKRLLYKLAELAIKEGNVGEAEDYYREFCDLASDDPRQYLLRYMILGAKGAPAEQLIHTLEQYCNVELDEKWLYELAILYNQAGMDDLCVLACDKIMLMFGLGKYVEKAMELKIQHAPLTKYQMDLEENRDKYEERLRAVEQEYEAPTRSFGFESQEHGRPMPVRRPTLVKPEPAQPSEDVPVYGERQPYRPYRRPQEEDSYEDQEMYQAQQEEDGRAEARYEGNEYGGEESRYGENTYGAEESRYGENAYGAEESRYGENAYGADASRYGENAYGAQESQYEENAYGAGESRYEENAYGAEESRYEENAYGAEESRYEENAYGAEESRYGENAYGAEESRYEENAYGGEESRYEKNGYGGEEARHGENTYGDVESRYQDAAYGAEESRYEENAYSADDTRHEAAYGADESRHTEDAYGDVESRYQDAVDGDGDSRHQDTDEYRKEESYEAPASGDETACSYQDGLSAAPAAGQETKDQQQDGQDDEGDAPARQAADNHTDGNQPEEDGHVVMEEDGQEEARSWELDQKPMTEETLAARVHEAEIQANLARELSHMSGAVFSEESAMAQTRVLKDIRSLKINGDVADNTVGRSSQVSKHLMIESEDPEEGLSMAVGALKQIHREMGIKNQAAKITGEKLNNKGVLALADKLTGKDLIIEYAGDMDDQTLQELDLLMSRDETGMNVVMIDNQEQLEAINSEYPGLAKRFERIGEIAELKLSAPQPHTARPQAASAQPQPPSPAQAAAQSSSQAQAAAQPQPPSPAQATTRPQPSDHQAADQTHLTDRLAAAQPQPPSPAQAAARPQPSDHQAVARSQPSDHQAAAQPQPADRPAVVQPKPPSPAQAAAQPQPSGLQAAAQPYPARSQAAAPAQPHPAPYLTEPAPEPQAQRVSALQRAAAQEPVYEEPRYQKEHRSGAGYGQPEYNGRSYDDPAYGEDFTTEGEHREEPEYEPSKKETVKAKDKTTHIPAILPSDKPPVYKHEAEPEDRPADDDEEMDIDEFAQYACQYAGEIDCSISGKSMLALYERIEIMEEDGIALTKAAAEELIEEAADKAEKPSLLKRIKGMFSSRYDKDGLLILKEEHFI